ncbi:hypothetical protein EMIHUDRAFT_311598 [Emiliania huxleyi CCMP1516]|uniref:Uncharacterized protein n=2 Tax=Emiliania huxleyi TaxID=2903 RepID=A0A0D3IJD2_EMIH1|nr:hypothetical protein EMIHUDRAFT_311598 [Emiliania huxleyi CCMP1516]EOD11367.1 hypothetical protein EMIHUDRAFT_311598 [Emiliania huxleyi CCMP1516]|eukprot:XP_005763796.1 hypothetical protein EMIHUDRAFT_311598 [Emiliania huxleyi CCMP1516]
MTQRGRRSSGLHTGSVRAKRTSLSTCSHARSTALGGGRPSGCAARWSARGGPCHPRSRAQTPRTSHGHSGLSSSR